MKAAWIIARRELDSFFDSLIAYIMLVLFLGFSGFFTWLLGTDIFLVGQANLESFFNVAFWTLFFFIPALTMRLLAEEKKTGTLELLLTKAVTDREVVMGKFLGTLLLVIIALAFTLPYAITISNIGNLDVGQVLCGYLGLLLISAMYSSIGLYASSITSNQIVAFLTALFIGLFFHIIFGMLAQQSMGWVGQLFEALSLTSHFESISRGVLDSRDVIYFASVVCIGLFLAELSLTKRIKEQAAAKSKFYTTAGLIAAIVVVINLLSYEYHLRLDLTEDRQYTLSRATTDILRALEEPITVKAYFSQNLPPNIVKTRQDFQDLLIEYSNRSDEQVLYEFINPNEKEDYEQEATTSGIRPVLINVREKDQVKQQKAFLGATVQLGEKKEVIPFLQPGAAMEYSLSTAIKKISIDNKPVIGFIQGHGEPPLMEMPQVSEQLGVLYQIREIALTDSTEIPTEIKTLAMIRPLDSIPATHLRQLDNFLSKGGGLLVALNSVQGDFRSMYGTPMNTGVEAWLQRKGVDVMGNFVIDAQCGSISVPQQFGAFSIQASVSFPYAPIISNFADHPVTTGLESVIFQFVSEVRFNGDSTLKFTPLAFSSDLSETMVAPQMFDINKEWAEEDFKQQHIILAGALEGKLSGDKPSKMVIIGDGDFPVNGPGQQQRQLQPDNVSLFSNAVDWLSDDTGLIELRTKGVISRPIDELDDTTKAILKYTNFLLPILLAVFYGLIRAQKNRAMRNKRMSENYETA